MSLLQGCQGKKFEGSLDADSVDRLDRASIEGSEITISSPGGDPVFGYAFGRIVFDRKLTVRLGEECSSSCAEFVLPAAARVVASSDTLIGFHGSDWIGHWVDKTYYSSSPAACEESRLTWLRMVYARRGLNTEAWREVARRLLIVDHEAEIDSGCLSSSIWKWNSIWFPTSAQMRDLFGYQEIESLCSDNEACWVPRLRSFGTNGTRYAVGDRFVRVLEDGQVVDFDPAELAERFLVPSDSFKT